MAKKIWRWVEGARISVDPQAACEEIEKEKPSSAEDLLALAQKKSSALHDAFEWDDRVAARKHRLEIARLILRSMSYEVRETPNGPVKLVRYYAAVQSQPEEERYVTYTRIMNDREMYDSMIAQLKRELRAFAERNARFRGEKALKEVFAAIEKL